MNKFYLINSNAVVNCCRSVKYQLNLNGFGQHSRGLNTLLQRSFGERKTPHEPESNSTIKRNYQLVQQPSQRMTEDYGRFNRTKIPEKSNSPRTFKSRRPIHPNSKEFYSITPRIKSYSTKYKNAKTHEYLFKPIKVPPVALISESNIGEELVGKLKKSFYFLSYS